jgi:hypothetical protein
MKNRFEDEPDKVVGADFNAMPPHFQEAVRKGLFEPHAWKVSHPRKENRKRIISLCIFLILFAGIVVYFIIAPDFSGLPQD